MAETIQVEDHREDSGTRSPQHRAEILQHLLEQIAAAQNGTDKGAVGKRGVAGELVGSVLE